MATIGSEPEILGDYALPLLCGVDTLEEAHNARFRDDVWEFLEGLKTQAEEADKRGNGRASFKFAGEDFQMLRQSPRKGYFIIRNEAMIIDIRSRDTDWCVSVKYISAALWEHGVDVMRERGKNVVRGFGGYKSEPGISLSVIHWAMDFHSPKITEDIDWSWVDLMVVPSGVKIRTHGASGRLETITVGSKSSLQIEVYEKGREIEEASGKHWMQVLWSENEYGLVIDSLADIWRVEVRFSGSGYLKDRGIRTYEAFMERKDDLIIDALSKRKLTQKTGDTNRSRRPHHPLWIACRDALKAWHGLPVYLDQFVSGRRDILKKRLVAQMAGTLRSTTVLANGMGFDHSTMDELLAEVKQFLLDDDDHEIKCTNAWERYKLIDEPE